MKRLRERQEQANTAPEDQELYEFSSSGFHTIQGKGPKRGKTPSSTKTV